MNNFLNGEYVRNSISLGTYLRTADFIIQPKIDSIFKPNNRAQAIGRVLAKDSDYAVSVGKTPGPFFKGKFTEKESVMISAFYGCAGAMVVVFDLVETKF